MITQFITVIALCVTMLLMAATTPQRKPITDSTAHRWLLSALVTMVVMMLPPCSAGAAYSLVMLVVGTLFMHGVMQLAIGPTPHKRRSALLIEARRPRGYQRLNLNMKRVLV